MPGTELGTRTEHFTFWWWDDVGPDAEANVEAIIPVAESDLATLAEWYGLAPLPDTFRSIQVRVNWPTLGSATNGGYQADLGINISSPPRAADPDGADEWVRAMFVMELAEILMSYRGQVVPDGGPWDSGDSVGEGLSRVMGAELHPIGYYGYGYQCMGSWISAGGPDYVTTDFTGGESREDGMYHYGDQYWPAFGCAAVFLYYLHSQLGFSWTAIITANGRTLQEKYAALGRAGNGFALMQTLLLDFYVELSAVPTTTDDPFPLVRNRIVRLLEFRPPPYILDIRPDPGPDVLIRERLDLPMNWIRATAEPTD